MLVSALLVLTAACSGPEGALPPEATGVDLSVAPADTLLVGDTARLVVRVREAGIDAAALRYTILPVSNAPITLDESGRITAVTGGGASIWARTPDGRTVGRVFLSVRADVRVSPASSALTIGAQQQLTATVRGLPPGFDLAVRWSSSDATVATVSEGGVVSALGLGAAVVEARSVVSPELRGSAKVTVAQNRPISLIVTPSTATLVPGATIQLAAALRDELGTSSGVTFTSSDTRVATVSATGLVTALESGVATITVASFRDASFRTTATVSVREPDTQRQSTFDHAAL